MNFNEELRSLINRASKENDSNTPDFVLATYMCSALNNFNQAVNERERWYGRPLHDGKPIELTNNP